LLKFSDIPNIPHIASCELISQLVEGLLRYPGLPADIGYIILASSSRSKKGDDLLIGEPRLAHSEFSSFRISPNNSSIIQIPKNLNILCHFH